MLGGGGGRSRTGLSGVAQAPASNRTKVLLFMCLPCISDCLSIFPNRSHDKLISPLKSGVIDRVSRHGEAYRGEGGFAILRDDEDDLNDQDGSSGRNKHEQGANSAGHGLLRGAGADELAHQQR